MLKSHGSLYYVFCTFIQGCLEFHDLFERRCQICTAHPDEQIFELMTRSLSVKFLTLAGVTWIDSEEKLRLLHPLKYLYIKFIIFIRDYNSF